MCKFILGIVPRAANLTRLNAAIPTTIRRRLIRVGAGEYAPPDAVAVEGLENPSVVSQFPGNDRFVRFTHWHCDCGSALGARRIVEGPPRELRRWLALIRLWIQQGFTDRIGLFIHFGDPRDAIILRGPIVHEVDKTNANDLEMWDWDTVHEFVP